ncbi:LysR family transcriptional regulator [Castellaniella caeni]|uniref:LysR family transcriptional regulator n=1 Tax=Castellaniella caeni TaxID=266123 RepID=UPI000830D44E|nr:LysR family transcriptional regulator [Castellaniella caeni]
MRQVQDTDLKTLRTFITVVKSGGFTAAQSVLGLGVSAISESMSSLEARLGVRLCDRGRAGFRLTEDGKAVFAATQRLLSSVEEFRLDVSSLTQILKGELRLGLIDNMLSNPVSPLTRALRNFCCRSDQLRIHIDIDLPYALEQGVLEGRLHLAVAPSSQRIRGLGYEPLMREEQGLYCGMNHPLFSVDEIRAEQLQEYRVISRRYLHGQDLKLTGASAAAAVADNAEARLMLLLTGEYIGFLPCHFAQAWVQAGELRHILPGELKYDVPFYLISRTGDAHSRVLSVFVQDVLGCLADAG